MTDTHDRPHDHGDLWDRFRTALLGALEEERQGYIRDRQRAHEAMEVARTVECHRVIRGIEALCRWVEDDLAAELRDELAAAELIEGLDIDADG